MAGNFALAAHYNRNIKAGLAAINISLEMSLFYFITLPDINFFSLLYNPF